MTYTKVKEFEVHLQELSRLANLLSHPARIAILKYLAETKTCISGNIAQELPLSRTTVSQHLQELKKGKLITGEIEGNTVCYCLNIEELKKFQYLIGNFFNDLDLENCIGC